MCARSRSSQQYKEELERIVSLSDKEEADIIEEIGVSGSNWDNAKKVLPRFAEQLEDVIRTGAQDGTHVLADAPGRAKATGPAAAVERRQAGPQTTSAPRAPRSSREVTPNTIGMAGIAEKFDEVPLPPPGDPQTMARAIAARIDRLRRHNLIVRKFAGLMSDAGAVLYEDPFDILSLSDGLGILVEVKTLDGTAADERDRVREAFGQVLYYQGFLAAAVIGEATVSKIACFENKVSVQHHRWLNDHGVAVVWKNNMQLVGDDLACDYLRKLLPDFPRG